jgi:superfamily II DNA or RNA helicase
MGTALSLGLGKKTLIIAHEKELLKQFYKTLAKFTNMPALEAKAGHPVAGIIKDPKDLPLIKKYDWDIVLITYQAFIRPGTGTRRVKRYLAGKFGLILIDESHLGNALAYSKFLSNLDSKFAVGLSATPERKDGLERIMEEVLGPVVARTDTIGLLPQVQVHDTKMGPEKDWTGVYAHSKAATWLARNKERNKMLARQVFADLRENPNHCIIIPCLRTYQINALVKLINTHAKICNEKRGENWSELLAVPYHGKSERDKTLERIRKGTRTRVIVAERKMCGLGLDIPKLTHMYLQFPMSNGPNFYQLTQRICTPMPGGNKPQPVLRIYVDNIGISRGCFRATWWNGVVARKHHVDPVNIKKAQIIIADAGGQRKFSFGKAKATIRGNITKAAWKASAK